MDCKGEDFLRKPLKGTVLGHGFEGFIKARHQGVIALAHPYAYTNAKIFLLGKLRTH